MLNFLPQLPGFRQCPVRHFTGVSGWRDEWEHEQRRQGFGAFVAGLFVRQMKKLNYLHTDLPDLQQVRTPDNLNNLPLYHLAFFSRHELGQKFWREAKKSVNPQLRLLL